MDYSIWTARPERERTCRACNWSWLDESDPGEHSCRTKPNVPRATLAERARAANRVLLNRELEIRRTRLAEIHARRG
jgi:hypothetical protein